jgi:hypothetical protein
MKSLFLPSILLLAHAVTVAAFAPLGKLGKLKQRALLATVEETKESTASTAAEAPSPYAEKVSCALPPFHNVMAANRAEIAVRIMRAATEFNTGTVAIYTREDRFSQHRLGADKSFELSYFWKVHYHHDIHRQHYSRLFKKPDGPISTGIGFLNQFNSHAQI